MKTVILFNRVSYNPKPDEADVLCQVQAVHESLDQLGHSAIELPFDLNLEAAKAALLKTAPDTVFNLVESVDGKGSLLHLAPSLLESLKIPYTGCPAEAIYTTSNKLLAKKLLKAADLPTPPWYQTGMTCADNTDFPAGQWIVKSLWEHASLGMDETAVISVRTRRELDTALAKRKKMHGGEWFAEQYIDGREFNMSILASDSGAEVMRPAEIRFNGFDNGKPRIVDYRAKWDTESFEYRNTVRSFEFQDVDRDLLTLLRELSLSCWNVFGLKGYARVDFRVDQEGRPWILEINTNPCLSEDAGFAAAILETGYKYTDAVRRIMNDKNG